MPQLDTSTYSSQLFWLVVCFFTLYLILSYIAVPKIARVLERREKTIEDQINIASAYREHAEDLLADYEKTLAQAKERAQQHVRSITTATAKEIGNKQKDFLDKVAERLHHIEQDLYRSRLEASKDVKSEAEGIAKAVLTKLTGRSYPTDKFLDTRNNT